MSLGEFQQVTFQKSEQELTLSVRYQGVVIVSYHHRSACYGLKTSVHRQRRHYESNGASDESAGIPSKSDWSEYPAAIAGDCPPPDPFELLAGGIAHDLMNVLTIILGNAELLLSDLPANAPTYNYADQIQAASQHASHLAQQLLRHVRRGSHTTEPININAIMLEVSQLLQVRIPATMTLNLQLDAQSPMIEADGTQIRQMILNLLFNAIEAIGASNGTIILTTQLLFADHVYLSAIQQGTDLPEGWYVAVTVADTGHGMDGLTQERIFAPWFSTKGSGHGLGMAVVLAGVHAHHGAIDIQSAPGQGTAITLLFPAQTY